MKNYKLRMKYVKARILVLSYWTEVENHIGATLDLMYHGLNTLIQVGRLTFVSKPNDSDKPGLYVWRHIELHFQELHAILVKSGWEQRQRLGERYYAQEGFELTMRVGSWGFVAFLKDMRHEPHIHRWFYKEGQMIFALRKLDLWKREKVEAA